MKRCTPWLTALVVLGPTLGCDDALTPIQLIDSPRVLGARVEVLDDPTRAWPEPGETARVEWLVASSEGIPATSWRFSVCAGTDSAAGNAACRGDGLFEASGATEAGELPRFEFQVPERTELDELLGSRRELVLLGAICAEIVTDAGVDTGGGLSCAEDQVGATHVSLRIGISAGSSNSNPSIAANQLRFDGESWFVPGDPDDACADPEVPRVSLGSKHELRIVSAGGDRETLAGVEPPAPERESLDYSHFVTAGELERPFSVIEWSDPEPAPYVSVEWVAPRSLPSRSSADFYVVVRDGRGGQAWARRSVCFSE